MSKLFGRVSWPCCARDVADEGRTPSPATLRTRWLPPDAARAALVSALAAATLAPFTLLPVGSRRAAEHPAARSLGQVGTGVVGLGAHLFLRPLNIFGDDPLDIPHDSARSARRPGFQLLLLQLCLLWTGALVVHVIGRFWGRSRDDSAELHSIAWILATLAVPLPLQSPHARCLVSYPYISRQRRVYALLCIVPVSLLCCALTPHALLGSYWSDVCSAPEHSRPAQGCTTG